jgi:superfamily II DNA or RNA helicase
MPEMRKDFPEKGLRTRTHTVHSHPRRPKQRDNHDEVLYGEMMEDYEWQKTVPILWEKNGRKGVVKAVPGAGKTRAGVRIAQIVLAENPLAQILIVAPTTQIMKQWEQAITETDKVANFQIKTYFWAAKTAKQPHETYDLVIFDECHSLNSEVRSAALEIRKKAWIGLSATPLGSEQKLGGLLKTVGWDEANISPFEISYIKFPLTLEQQVIYKRLTDEVKNAYIAHEHDQIDESQLMMTVMKRRNYVYKLGERVRITLELVKKHPDDRIIIFAERLEQVNEIAANLYAKGMACAIYTSETDQIEYFKNHDVRILVTSRMVKEGFNDPTTSIGIIASTPLTERNQVQTIGRIIRFFPDKVADIYIILAAGTTDERLIRDGMKGKILNYQEGQFVVSARPIRGIHE